MINNLQNLEIISRRWSVREHCLSLWVFSGNSWMLYNYVYLVLTMGA